MQSRKINRYLQFIKTLAIARFIRRKVPLIAILGVTNRCNLKCSYCYGEHPYRSSCREFTTEELLDLVYNLSRLGSRILQLQGGEPLLRDDLNVIIKQARRCGMICDMVTNGTLIQRRVDAVRLLDRICISLDGPREINDRNRGEGSFEKIIEGVRISSGLGLSVRISAVLTPESSRGDIDWLVNFSDKYDAYLNFSPTFDFLPHFNADSPKPRVIPDKQMRGLLRHIIQRKKEGAPIQFSATSYHLAARWPFSYQKIKVRKDEIPADFIPPRCYHGDYVVFIDSNGSVYPCCNFWGRPRWNIRTDGLEASISGLSRDGCAACYIPSYIDRNLFFGSRPGVWLNYLTQALKNLQ